MSNLSCTRADGREAYEAALRESFIRVRSAATAAPSFPVPLPMRPEPDYLPDGPQPDWDAADRALAAPAPVPDEWSALPPIPKREKDWRHDEAYCAALADWVIEHVVDRCDAVAIWDAKEHEGKGGWKCSKNRDERYVHRALMNSFRGTGSSWHWLIGGYIGDPVTRTCKALRLDIDGHKDGDTPDEDLRKCEAFCVSEGIRYFLASSKSNNGSHPVVLLEPGVPYLVTHNFGNLIKKLASLPAKTEVNPKTPRQNNPFGNQVAIFGSRHFFEKTGGSMVIRNGTHENVPFEEWIDYLSSIPKMTLAEVLAFGQRHGVDLRDEQGTYARKARVVMGGDLIAVDPAPRIGVGSSEPAARGFVPREHDIGTLQAFITFLTKKGYAPTRIRPDGPGCYKVAIPRCVLEEKHSSKTDYPVLFYDESIGAIVWHNCQHASCNAVEKLTAPVFLRRVGVEYTTVHRETPPALRPPTPPAIRGTGEQVVDEWSALPPVPGCDCEHDHPPADPLGVHAKYLDELEPTVATARGVERRLSLTDAQRQALSDAVSRHHKVGSRVAVRALRVMACALGTLERWCKTHGKRHVCPLTCQRPGMCVNCAGVYARERAEAMARDLPEEVGFLYKDFGNGIAVHDATVARKATRAFVAQTTLFLKRKHITQYRFFEGVHSVGIWFTNPEDAGYVSDLFREIKDEGKRALYAGVYEDPGAEDGERRQVLSRCEIIEAVSKIIMEPSEVLAQLLTTVEGREAVVTYPFLTEKRALRTWGGRKGEQLPWPTADEVRASKRERAREAAIAKGMDPDEFDADTCSAKQQGPDGRLTRCGAPYETRVSVDGVEIAHGRAGGASWRVGDEGFRVMSAMRLELHRGAHRLT